MRAPYGLNIIDNCLICPVREEHLFCNLSLPAVQRLDEIKSTAMYPKSTMLFVEGQQPRGVFVLCAGKPNCPHLRPKAKLSSPRFRRPEMSWV
jgi:CRP/FNR family cyclic AMP-dependent transcriptional regulator